MRGARCGRRSRAGGELVIASALLVPMAFGLILARAQAQPQPQPKQNAVDQKLLVKANEGDPKSQMLLDSPT